MKIIWNTYETHTYITITKTSITKSSNEKVVMWVKDVVTKTKHIIDFMTKKIEVLLTI
jgi:hypothetical protein